MTHADHFTTTETDAAAYEYAHAEPDDFDPRSELDIDELEQMARRRR